MVIIPREGCRDQIHSFPGLMAPGGFSEHHTITPTSPQSRLGPFLHAGPAARGLAGCHSRVFILLVPSPDVGGWGSAAVGNLAALILALVRLLAVGFPRSARELISHLGSRIDMSQRRSHPSLNIDDTIPSPTPCTIPHGLSFSISREGGEMEREQIGSGQAGKIRLVNRGSTHHGTLRCHPFCTSRVSWVPVWCADQHRGACSRHGPPIYPSSPYWPFASLPLAPATSSHHALHTRHFARDYGCPEETRLPRRPSHWRAHFRTGAQSLWPGYHPDASSLGTAWRMTPPSRAQAKT